MSGACISSIFSVFLFYYAGVHTGFPFGLTVFPSHHMFPQVLKDPLTDVSLSPAPGSRGYCIPGPLSSRLTHKSSGLALCPLPRDPLWSESPAQGGLPKVAAESELTGVSHISIRLSLCLATSTRLIVPPP